jgi:hypothetical protein
MFPLRAEAFSAIHSVEKIIHSACMMMMFPKPYESSMKSMTERDIFTKSPSHSVLEENKLHQSFENQFAVEP